jgi:PPM family protein phosphatase
MNLRVGAASDTGLVRDGNEDSYLVDEPLFVVADGMGGHLAGDVASSTAIEIISGAAASASHENPDSLARLLRDANAAIFERAQNDPSLRGMGTTCTLLMVDGEQAHLAHVGDSRAYLLRDGELSQLTEDHTLVSRMVREGKLSVEEAEQHPQRSIITRALGVDPDVEVDLLALELKEGDRILLCSDGLSSMISFEAIKEALQGDGEPQRAADALVRRALDAGGEDNVTVVVLDVTGASGLQPSPPNGRAAAVGTQQGEGPPTDPGIAPQPTGMGTAVAEREVTPTPAEPADEDHSDAHPPRRSWKRKVLLTVIVLAILGGAGYAAARYALDNSFYVGLDNEGTVTIYKGIPDEIAGFSLSEQVDSSSLTDDDLPDFQLDDVEANKRFDSLEEAHNYVENLERDVRESLEETRRQNRKKSN